MPRTILQVRRGMCLTIAESLETHFRLDRRQNSWDSDEAAKIIGSHLPLTYAEAQAEWDAMEEKEERESRKPHKPLLDPLREALGLGREIGLRELFKAAVERIQAANHMLGKPGNQYVGDDGEGD